MPSVFYQTRHLKNRKTNRKRWAYTLCDVSYYSATLCPPCHTSILRQPPVRGGLPLELNLRSAMVEAEVVQLLLQVFAAPHGRSRIREGRGVGAVLGS